MSAEDALFAALTGATEVTNLVSTRVYRGYVPQEVQAPCIAFDRVATEHVNTIHGTVLASRASLEIWCMAEQGRQADRIADAVTPIAAGQKFIPTGRRAEFDVDSGIWSTVISVDHWQT